MVPLARIGGEVGGRYRINFINVMYYNVWGRIYRDFSELALGNMACEQVQKMVTNYCNILDGKCQVLIILIKVLNSLYIIHSVW